MSILTRKKTATYRLKKVQLDERKQVIVYHFENVYTDLANKISIKRYVPFAENKHINLGAINELLPLDSKLEF